MPKRKELVSMRRHALVKHVCFARAANPCDLVSCPQAKDFLQELKGSEQGDALIAWGQKTLAAAQEDPETLQGCSAFGVGCIGSIHICGQHTWKGSGGLRSSHIPRLFRHQHLDTAVPRAAGNGSQRLGLDLRESHLQANLLDLWVSPSSNSSWPAKVSLDRPIGLRNGVLKLDGLIEKGQKYIESDTGTEFLREAQKKALNLTKLGLLEQASGYIKDLENCSETKNSSAFDASVRECAFFEL